jgi:hypothetical protein
VLDDRGVGVRVSVVLRILPSPRRPDTLWGPPSPLSYKCWGLKLTTHKLVPRSRQHGSIHPHPHASSWQCLISNDTMNGEERKYNYKAVLWNYWCRVAECLLDFLRKLSPSFWVLNAKYFPMYRTSFPEKSFLCFLLCCFKKWTFSNVFWPRYGKRQCLLITCSSVMHCLTNFQIMWTSTNNASNECCGWTLIFSSEKIKKLFKKFTEPG